MNGIDPRLMKEILKLEMLNKSALVSGASGGSAGTGAAEGEFGSMLNALLLEQAGLDSGTEAAGSLPLQALQTGWSGLSGEDLAAGTAQMSPAALNQALRSYGSASTPASAPVSRGEGAYDAFIAQASSRTGVDPALIKAVIRQESSFNTTVVSKAGAKGLMQLMDGTAKGLGVTNPFDPQQSIEGGAQYLSYQLKRFDGNVGTALAAYNAGPNRVSRLGIKNDKDLLEKMHLLPTETQQYVKKVMNHMERYERDFPQV